MLSNLRKIIYAGEGPHCRDIVRVYCVIIDSGQSDILDSCQISTEENEQNARQIFLMA